MKCQKGDVCMADDLVILAQFVKLGRLRKKVFMELAQKEISQICKLGEKKGKYCTSSTYHAVYDLIDKGLVEYVDPDTKRRKEVRLTDLGYNDYLENLSVGVCRLQEQYGLTSYRREKFINRIRCEDHVRRRSNGRFTVLEKVES